MIVITIDGMPYKLAKRCLEDTFKAQTMKEIKCNISKYTNTPEKGQPTLVGLVCLWTGTNPSQFDKNLMCQINPKLNQNYPVKLIKKNGDKMDSIFEHFNISKLYTTTWGPNPFSNNEIYFKHFTEIPNLELLPTEENTMLYEVTKPYDLIWWHTGITIAGSLRFGPYEQGEHPLINPYRNWRHDKKKKEEVFEFSIRRFKYLMQCLEKMTNDIIIVSTDHGTYLSDMNPEDLYNIPIIVNRDVDLSKVNFQWDIKDFLLELKNAI